MNEALRATQARLFPAIGLAMVAVVLGTAVVLSVFVFSQDLAVVQSPNGAFIDVTWLGEYQANVRQIRLTELATGKVVWDLKAAQGRSFPLWQVAIQAGQNVAVPGGVVGAEVLAPAARTFDLAADTAYRIDLWTYKDWGVPRHVSTTFRLAKPEGANPVKPT